MPLRQTLSRLAGSRAGGLMSAAHQRLGRLAMVVWILFGFLVIIVADVIIGTPNPGAIRSLTYMPQTTTLYDAQDKPVFSIFKERRIEVPLQEISPNLIQAVLAIEDQRFYRHFGLDLWRIGGAAMANLRHRDAIQGASTITQQLARKSFLSDDKTIRRKLKEMYLALRLEQRFTKNEILELYLNKVYFGDGYYGVEAAARGYFGKAARDLTVEEAALLAGLIQAPSAYAPTEHLERAVARRAVVLGQMAEAGFIDAGTATSLAGAPVRLKSGFTEEQFGQYFKNQVTRQLVDRFGWEMVSQGGLRVYTTIDPKAQRAAEAALEEGLAGIERLGAFRSARRREARVLKVSTSGDSGADRLQGALVAMMPLTGEVRALVGGRDFGESQFDRAIQAKRQAGSAFKPFVYAAALDMGYTPATLLTGLDDPVLAAEGDWVPEDEHIGSSSMTVRAALRSSSNRAAVQVLRSVGIPHTVNYLERLGLEAPPVPSLALGSGDVSLLSLTAAYAVFANGGYIRTPVLIRRVEDRDGDILFAHHSPPMRAVSEDSAFLMAQMLADVVNHGTGYRVRQAGFRLPAGGKTGTTNDYRDAWFMGFTPHLVAGVWVGFDQPRPIMHDGYAGVLAAPIWGRFMRDAAGHAGNDWIPQPHSIVTAQVCRVSGALATTACRHDIQINQYGEITERSQVVTEYFRRGTEPQSECPIHGFVRYGDDYQGTMRFGRGDGGASDDGNGPGAEGKRKSSFWRKFISVFKGDGGFFHRNAP
jgi:penicillin-binding protein 1A